jgi:hypothetical protein
MATETTVTSRGSSIPRDIRRKAGISAGTVITWTLQHDGVIVGRKKSRSLNAVQRHIRAHAGTWDGDISGAELLRKTRP